MFITKKIVLSFFLFLFISFAKSQDYNYIHYSYKDGLAGNTVYGVTQDKDGYLFFATENGVSRYDGKEWKTFTVKDGLPDNEVLMTTCDHNNRVWLTTFNKKICYYKNGKIWNEENDSLVRKTKLNNIVYNLFNDDDGNIMFGTSNEIFGIDKSDNVHNIAFKDNQKISQSILFGILKNAYDSGSLLLYGDSVFVINKYQKSFCTRLRFNKKRNFLDLNAALLKHFKTSTKFVEIKRATINAASMNSCDQLESNNDIIFFNTNDGSWLNSLTNKFKEKQFMKGHKVGHSLIDKEGNYWFTTLGEGVFKLPSEYVINFVDFRYPQKIKEVFSVTGFEGQILAGSNYSKLLKQTKNKFESTSFADYTKNSKVFNEINRITCIVTISNNISIIGFDAYLLKLQNNQLSFNYNLTRLKSVEKIDHNNIVVATGTNCFKVRVNDLAIIDTITTDRTTYAFYQNNHYYVGTLSGLYKIDSKKHQSYLGSLHSALKRRIVCIKSSRNGILYIATADAGIVALKDDKIIGEINEENGLSSNSCKTLHINNNSLWVGTIKGINKIDLANKKTIIKYSTSDGLPSDIINAIYLDNTDTTVWVGSPEGLTSFKEQNINSTSICNLVMQNITVSNRKVSTDSNNFQFKYTDNNIQFNYAAISFRSGEDIVYSYKLIGLDTGFITTNERLLNYPTLPYGSYTLQLFATNKFGLKSNTLQYKFTIATPFWKTSWFMFLVMFFIIITIYNFLKRRFDKAKKMQAEKAAVKHQLAAMEQLALQAQMNPHFIFNCLNSIQQFILAQETEKANKYLVLFSRLIRNTLDNSEKKNITLTNEIDYLQHYLILEQLRFGDKFNYQIMIANDIVADEINLPAMLLQPFVENSLRHGIRQLVNKNGSLSIEFYKLNNYLVCTIEDNGIGRAAAEKYKSTMHIEYQSKGMQLTAKRVDLLNTDTTHQITIEVIDLKDSKDNAMGTKVIVSIPIPLN